MEIGSRVIVRNKFHGVIRFIGPTHYAKGEWIGIEVRRCFAFSFLVAGIG